MIICFYGPFEIFSVSCVWFSDEFIYFYFTLQIKTLLPGEHQQVMGNLKTRFEEFLEDSQESKMFSVSDISQLEREVHVCKLYYEELLKSAERGDYRYINTCSQTDHCSSSDILYKQNVVFFYNYILRHLNELHKK